MAFACRSRSASTCCRSLRWRCVLGGRRAPAFLAAYPSLCQDAAKRLRGLYNPADYPPVDDAAREFGFSWQYVSFGVPDQLKGISQEVWEQEREEAAQRMAEASSEPASAAAIDGRSGGAHGGTTERGRGREAAEIQAVDRVELGELLSNFSFRNVTDDQELQSLVTRARELLQGVEADDLRTAGDLRVRLKAGMSSISEELDGMMQRSGAGSCGCASPSLVDDADDNARLTHPLTRYLGCGAYQNGTLAGVNPSFVRVARDSPAGHMACQLDVRRKGFE